MASIGGWRYVGNKKMGRVMACSHCATCEDYRTEKVTWDGGPWEIVHHCRGEGGTAAQEMMNGKSPGGACAMYVPKGGGARSYDDDDDSGEAQDSGPTCAYCGKTISGEYGKASLWDRDKNIRVLSMERTMAIQHLDEQGSVFCSLACAESAIVNCSAPEDISVPADAEIDEDDGFDDDDGAEFTGGLVDDGSAGTGFVGFDEEDTEEDKAYLAANELYQNGKYSEAIDVYTSLIKLTDSNDDKSRCYHGRGEAYESLGKYKEAIADYSKAIEFDPVDGCWSYRRRGICYRQTGKNELALADLNKDIEGWEAGLTRDAASPYFTRGTIHRNLGNSAEAAADFARAAAMAEEDDARKKYSAELQKALKAAAVPAALQKTITDLARAASLLTAGDDTEEEDEAREAQYDKLYAELLKALKDLPAAAPKASAPAGKKFCSECGAELREGAKFCTECGTKV